MLWRRNLFYRTEDPNGMNNYSPERPLTVQEVNRVCPSEQCQNLLRPHRLTLYVDEENYQCLVCGRASRVKHGSPEETASNIPYMGLSRGEAERIRRNLMAIIGDIQTRKWSKGMGDKDKGFIKRIISRLVGIGKDLDINE